jgi:uncharacterized protein
MPIIAREREQARFLRAIQSDQSEFIAMYGRRRTGKTFLIKEYFNKQICFHITGIQDEGKATQLEAFAQEVANRTKKTVDIPKNWVQAFSDLRKYIESIKNTKGKKVIFIDELPWLDTQRSGCLRALAHFWNHWAAWEKNIILVICGSASSWIIKKVLNDKKGLHNRVTAKINLQPFTLQETEQYLIAKKISLSRYQIVVLYMALGGIPFYLNEVMAGQSADENIHRICMDANGALHDEFDNLYKALFEKAENHIKIVKALASKTSGLTRTELLAKVKLSNGGSRSRILDELIDNGFMQYLQNLGKTKNGGTYILTDYFSRFHLQFIANQKTDNWMSIVQTGTWYNWAGIVFEQVCRDHLQAIKHALGISAVSTNIRFMQTAATQIDLIIERKDNVVHLCEIKFLENEFEIKKQYAENLQNKISNLRSRYPSRKTIFPTLISTFGCKKNAHSIGLITNEVILNQLFFQQK